MDILYSSKSSKSSKTRARARNGPRSFVTNALLCGALVLAPSAALASDAGEMSKSAGIGVGSAFASLIYTPVKLCYATGGLLVGGLAWAFSGGDNNVAKVVLVPSVLGDYVVTPQHLKGDHQLEFFGRDPKYAPDEVDVAASPSRSSSDSDYDQAW
jgi:hypothetical protein